jgi:hypothetical protein
MWQQQQETVAVEVDAVSPSDGREARRTVKNKLCT